jgi:hypothetical protein
MDKRIDYLTGIISELANIKTDDTYHQLQDSSSLKHFLDDPR